MRDLNAERESTLTARSPWERLQPIFWAIGTLGVLVLSLVWWTSNKPSLEAPTAGWDFGINWIAAQGWRHNVSVYDFPALHQLDQQLIGLPARHRVFEVLFESYINPPTTALLTLPFTVWPFAEAHSWYQITSILAFGAAVLVAGATLPPAARPGGWLVGATGLLTSFGLTLSLQLGQVDAWITLLLAVGIWAIHKERWAVAGGSIALAALLKISPGLLLLYLVARKKWAAAAGAAVCTVVAVALTAAIGHGGDWIVWVRDVLPALAGGSITTMNVALPAWLARLIVPAFDPTVVLTAYPSDSSGLGGFRLLSPLVALALLWIIWRRDRGPVPQPLAVALVTLVALLAGPVAWTAYSTWAIVPLVMMMNPALWRPWPVRVRVELGAIILLGGLLLALPWLSNITPELIQSMAWRFLTGLHTLGLLLWLLAGLVLQGHSMRVPATPAIVTDERRYA